MYDGPVIDACVNHTWSDQVELMEYMSRGWQEFLGRPGLLPCGFGMIPVAAGVQPRRPGGEMDQGAVPPGGGAAGSSFDLLKQEILDRENLTHAVLSFDNGALSMALANPYATAEVARAANDWTVDRWLSRDSRLLSLILVPNQLVVQSVEEIRRLADHPQIVGVLMGANGIGRTFGHPVYHPIYEAAEQAGLPLVIKCGSELPPDSPTNTTAAGQPATYGEYKAFAAQPVMTHLTSMICQGVFEKFPDLKVFVTGVGVTWIPALLWRFDEDYKAYYREIPWVKEMPSAYFYRHVRIGANPIERAPPRDRLLRAYRAIENLESMMCYVSSYPDTEQERVDDVVEFLPEEWRQGVMHANAADLFLH